MLQNELVMNNTAGVVLSFASRANKAFKLNWISLGEIRLIFREDKLKAKGWELVSAPYDSLPPKAVNSNDHSLTTPECIYSNCAPFWLRLLKLNLTRTCLKFIAFLIRLWRGCGACCKISVLFFLKGLKGLVHCSLCIGS